MIHTKNKHLNNNMGVIQFMLLTTLTTMTNLRGQVDGEIIPVTFGKFVILLVQKIKNKLGKTEW